MQQKVIFQLGTCWLMSSYWMKKKPFNSNNKDDTTEMTWLAVTSSRAVGAGSTSFYCLMGFCVALTKVKVAVTAVWPPLHSSLRFPSAASALSLSQRRERAEAAAPSGHRFHWLASSSVAEQGGASDVEAVFFFSVRCGRDNELIHRVDCCLLQPRQADAVVVVAVVVVVRKASSLGG